MDAKTYFAVAELVQAAAHQHGITGPVQFTVLAPKERCSSKAFPAVRVRPRYAVVKRPWPPAPSTQNTTTGNGDTSLRASQSHGNTEISTARSARNTPRENPASPLGSYIYRG